METVVLFQANVNLNNLYNSLLTFRQSLKALFAQYKGSIDRVIYADLQLRTKLTYKSAIFQSLSNP
jgi:hypothetical protein